MTAAPLNRLVHQLRQATRACRLDDRSDQELLERHLGGDAAAFEALVWRHRPAVLAVCRNVLGHEADAEDAFQATFLTLLRDARSIRRGDAIGGWLSAVAHRIAVQALTTARRRRRREQRAARREEAPPAPDLSWREACAVLHEELERLPQSYRLPLLLCYFDGKSRDEAAQQLGWSLQSLKGRLERGRQKLRGRLARRGIALSAGLLAGVGNSAAASTVLPRLVLTTLKAAAGPVPAPVADLLHGVTPAMRRTCTVLFAALLGVALAATAAVALTAPNKSAPPQRPPVPAKSRDGKRKAMVYVYPERLTAKDTLSDGPAGKPIEIKAETTFVWMEPGAGGGSEYVLIAAGGTRIVKGRRWPVINGKDLREARKEKERLESLRGTWVIESAVDDGKKEQQTKKTTVTIVDRLLSMMMEGDFRESFSIKLDVTCTPGVIDLTPLARDGSKGKDPIEGIYEIRQGRLRLCFSIAEGVRQRPVAFESKKGSRTLLLTLRRSQPKEAK